MPTRSRASAISGMTPRSRKVVVRIVAVLCDARGHTSVDVVCRGNIEEPDRHVTNG
jgi:hypothetical protein